MAESQGANGSIWNDRAVALLELFGWEYLGDKNIDVKGSDGKEHGLDAITTYDSPTLSVKQSCIVESKRYGTGSLSPAKIKEWIETLKMKMDTISGTEEVQEELPALKECCPIDLGVIMCWVHDATDENYFETKFRGYLSKALFETMAKPMAYKRIIMLTNPRIIRLCSMASEIRSSDYDYCFVYPSQLINDKPLKRQEVLSVEYMTSDIIIAERTSKKNGTKESVVFYFGRMSIDAFSVLYEALTMFNAVESDKHLVIYHYEDDEDSRIIIPEVKKLFREINVSFEAMQHFDLMNEPAILKRNVK